MAITYKDDPARGAGYGILIFTGVLPPEGPWSLALQRSRDHNFATGRDAESWVGETFFVPLEGEIRDDGSLELFLGPGIVDGLDPQEGYRVILKGADGEPVKGRLAVDAVTYSANAALGRQQPPKPPEKQQASPGGEPAAAEPKADAAPEQIAMPESPQKAKKNPNVWRYIILGGLILLCVLWFALDPRKKEDAPQQGTTAQSQPREAPATLSAQQRVSDFFKSPDKTAQKAMALAEELPVATDADKDAVYRLFYFAAEAGNGQASLRYGECLDPSRAPWGSIEKDALMAWREYGKAIEANVPTAAEARDNLRKWLEERSASGDGQATRWLEDINRK